MLKNALLALAASAAYLFRSKAIGVPQRVLVVQGGKMGDMICTTPLLRALKQGLPGSHLAVMGDKLNGDILAGNPRLDEYIVRPGSVLTFARRAREGNFDTALVTGPDTEALLALLLARVPVVVAPRITNGWSPYETKTYLLMTRFVRTMPHAMGAYAPREYLRLLEPLGIHTGDTRKELVVAPEAVASAEEKLFHAGVREGERLIGLAPSVGNKVKRWGGEKFARVANTLGKRRGARIVILDGKMADLETEAMRSALSPELPVADLAGKLSVEELKAVIRKLSLFISVDTGPIYIAEAFGIPTVDIVGPMDENEQPPRGGKHRVVVPEREKPMLHIMNASVFDWGEARRQAEAILPEMVIREAESLL